MADTRITDLTEDTAPAAGDFLVTVDVSDTTAAASGTNKKAQVANLVRPAGSGAELQYRAGANALGAVANVTRGANGNLLLAAQSTPGSLADGELFQGTQKTLSASLNGLTHRFVGCLFTQTALGTQVNNSTAEAGLIGAGVGTLTLPANFLMAGKTLRVTACVAYSTTTTAGTVTFRLKLGSVTVLTSVVLGRDTNQTGQLHLLSGLVTCQTAGAGGKVDGGGSVFSYSTNTIRHGAWNGAVGAGTTVDTTVGQVLDLTGQLSLAGTGVTLQCYALTVEVLN
jgi:hypothetical protein